MTTLRQIERLWTARAYGRLIHELIANRPEASFQFQSEVPPGIPAAAIAIIRLDELNQSDAPLCAKLIHTLIARQEADGGWGDPMISSLCLRALMTSRGYGEAINRGLTYLANLQQVEGSWPKIPLRRMPADATVSAFVLYQLGEDPRFRQAVRFADALLWFEKHQSSLDADARRLWNHAKMRCQSPFARREILIWS